jgi:hypothetical protein
MTETIFVPAQGAILSECLRYRYVLWRAWDVDLPSMTWIMLNPSTADAERDDATIRICRGRAERTGYGAIYVVNLFALRATDPQALYRIAARYAISEPNRPWWNDQYIETYARRSDTVICAWGNNGLYARRGALVRDMLACYKIRLLALKITKAGQPCHPLRISYTTQPMPFV